MDDINEQIEENMPLVYKIVNSFNVYPKTSTQKEDMIDAGRIGLWKGLEKFDKNLGNKISTYLWRPIKWEIIKYLRSEEKRDQDLKKAKEKYINKSSIKINIWEHYTDDMTENEKEILNLRAENHTYKEISKILKISDNQVKLSCKNAIKKIKESNE